MATQSSLLSKWKMDSGTKSGGLQLGMKGDFSISTKSNLLSSSLLLGSVGLTSGRKHEDSLTTKKKPYALTTKKSERELTSKLGSLQGSLSTSSNLLQSSLLNTVALTTKSSQSGTSTLLRPATLSTKLDQKKGDTKRLNLSSSTVSQIKLTSTFVPSRQTSVEDSAKSTFLSSTTSVERTATKPVSFGQRPSAVKPKASLGKSKKKPLETEDNLRKVTAYDISPPEYDLRWDTEDRKPIQLARFQKPEDSVALMIRENSLHDVNGKKQAFVNCISGSLICSPNFKDPSNAIHGQILKLSEAVIIHDPEFILKVALYTRKELNIRTTANFLLAVASRDKMCRPYLKKYFSKAVVLPSDWIEIAVVYQGLFDKTLNFGSLPAALRRAMIAKFSEFDAYQLAKYNKDSSKKKKPKKKNKPADTEEKVEVKPVHPQKKKDAAPPMLGSDSESDDEEEDTIPDFQDESSGDEEERRDISKLKFTLKQLIRKLHITEPTDHVMCLLGKKYPATLEEFYQKRLPGTWEEERAGKRMKLPVPETWETQVSLKGNKAATWEALLDHKKLPFMAMLRNLRNMIKAGVSSKHHTSVLKKLTDQRAVVNSKQFPFRFFSAYEVLDEMDKDYVKNQADLVQAAVDRASGGGDATEGGRGGRGRGGVRGRGRGRGCGGAMAGAEVQWWLKKKGPKELKEVSYDSQLIGRYRKALDKAVQIATTYNIQPIRGRTIILCNTGYAMLNPCTSAKGLGKPRTCREVAVLLGLMCKYSCEASDFVVFDNTGYTNVELQKGTILDNMQTVLEYGNDYTALGKNIAMATKVEIKGNIPYNILDDYLRDRIQVDNIFILSPGIDPDKDNLLSGFLKKYRRLVNPGLLFVSLALSSNASGFTDSIKPQHDNDIYLSGFSDQVLRFIAERGDTGQLTHINNIDTKYNLKAIAPVTLETGDKKAVSVSPDTPLPIPVPTPRWRTVRVFISSTFRDMHGERDLLTRFVFPELRARLKQHFINLYEVDLRWGVTEEDTKSNKTLELCLSEISKCQFFIGILGSRYGWTPKSYEVPDSDEFDWVREYPPNRSVTELEMHYAALAHPQTQKGKAFFYIREDDTANTIPKEFYADFHPEDESVNEKLQKLKLQARKSGLQTYNGYPCQWGGVVDGKPVMSGLEKFGSSVINSLWNAISKTYLDQDSLLDEDSHESMQHMAFIQKRAEEFLGVGRNTLIKQCLNKMTELQTGVLGLIGKPGCGKSSVLAKLAIDFLNSNNCSGPSAVIVHVVGATLESAHITPTLRRLCQELSRNHGLGQELPEDFKNLVGKFKGLLTASAKQSSSGIVVFIDGIDGMDNAHQPPNLEWLPEQIPQKVLFVLTAQDKSPLDMAMRRRKVEQIMVSDLDMWEKAEIVRRTLVVHRKSLSESPFNNQLNLLLSKKDAHNPLFLKLACEELRVFGVFEKINPKLKSLPHTVSALLNTIMSRIETDLGREFVSTALSLLVCARDGLTAGELYDLLCLHHALSDVKYQVMDVVNVSLLPEQRLPQIKFAQLQRSLEAFLSTTAGSSRLSLAHGNICSAIRMAYMPGTMSEVEMAIHRLLAGYFYQMADPLGDGSWKGNNARAVQELPYHLSSCGAFKELNSTLGNLCFVEAKCRHGLASSLLEDYVPKVYQSRTLDREQQKFLSQPSIESFKSFVSRNLYILASHPALTFQQSIHEPVNSAVYKEAMELMTSRSVEVASRQFMKWDSHPEEIDPCRLLINNLAHPVTCVAISPDGRFIACGDLDCVVHLYELSTGKEVRMFCGHADAISDVCFVGPSRLCSASHDNTLSVWDVQLGHRVHVFTYHQRRINSCAGDPNGQFVATASWDCTVKIWNLNKFQDVTNLEETSPVNCVAFHPEDQKVVIGTWEGLIKIWDVFNKTRKAVLRGHKSSVRDVAYSPSGRHIASAALDGEVKLWSALNATQVGTIRGHALPINKLAFSLSGKELITVSDDHKVKMWSGHMGIEVHCIGNKDNDAATSVAFSPDGETVAVGYHEGATKLFDVTTGLLVYQVQRCSSSVRCTRYSKSGNNLFVGSDDSTVKVLDSLNGNKICVLVGHDRPILCIEVCGEYIATGSEDFTCCIYKSSIKPTRHKDVLPMVTLRKHTGAVTSCSFNRDESLLATGSRDQSVMIWDMIVVRLSDSDSSPVPTKVLQSCHSDWITDCKWSNMGDYLVTSSNDFNIKVWQMNTYEERKKLTGHMSAINSVAYNYGCIVSGSSDGSVKVWSQKGTEITTLHGHTDRVNVCDMWVKVQDSDKEEEGEDYSDWAAAVEAAESPKQQKKASLNRNVTLESVVVATCSDDGSVRIWKPLLAKELACLTGHSDKILSVATDKSGQLCSSSLDSSIRVWQPKIAEEVESSRHNAEVTCIVCSEIEGRILSSSRDGTVKVWECIGAESDGPPRCVCTFQAHEKAVNAVCFVNCKGTKFVTGSDDGRIIVWDLVIKQNKIVARKHREYQNLSPVTCLAWNNSTVSKSGQLFFSADWNLDIKSWNTDKPECLEKINKAVQGGLSIKDWIMKMQFVGKSRTTLLILMADGSAKYIDTKPSKASKKGEYELTGVSVSIPNPPNVLKTIPQHKQVSNWLLDACEDEDEKVTAFVDYMGQMKIIPHYKQGSAESLPPRQIHSGPVTGVATSQLAMFTGSRDRTIKVWSKSREQIGQFFCPAPVTCLKKYCEPSSCVKLVVGDALGNVHFMTWHHKCISR